MEFRILGPLEVWDGGCEVSLGGRKPRALLTLLLLHPNEVVSADRLIDELWCEDPPERAAAALRVNVSRLRKALPQDVLTTRSPGYVIRVEPDDLDLHVAFLELYGTAVGAWSWAASMPGTGMPVGNAPSGIASIYVLFDIAAIALAPRLLNGFEALRLRPPSLIRPADATTSS